MAIPHLIYCAGGNRRLVEIAVDAGWLYGAQLPDTVYTDVAPLWFADQDWKKPKREAYMKGLKKHSPTQATVLDLEREEQFNEVMDWAEEAVQYIKRVVIIPKVFGIIPRIPYKVNSADVILGYSVPTKYAGTEVPTWEFGNRPVHLLGGSPHKQMEMTGYLNVVSADGNYAQKMAVRYCQFWVSGTARYAKNRYFPTLRESDPETKYNDAPYEAFRRSCENIINAWKR